MAILPNGYNTAGPKAPNYGQNTVVGDDSYDPERIGPGGLSPDQMSQLNMKQYLAQDANRNAPAAGTAAAGYRSNLLNGSNAANLASIQGLLKALGF